MYVGDKTWVDNTYFITKKKVTAFSLKYLVAILNSDLMRYYIDIVGKKKEFEIEIGSTFLKNLPIILRRGSLSKSDLNIINNIEKLISKIIELEKQNKNIDSEVEELNNLVFVLYDVNDEEKNLIKDYLSKTSSKLYF